MTEELVSINQQLPVNQFEQLMYYERVYGKLLELQEQVAKRISTLKEELSGITTDTKYHLVDVFDNKKTTIIDTDGLKNDNPELYRKCLSITGSNAIKLIGEDKLYQLCLKYAGEERTLLSSSLTLKRMKQVMTKEEYEKYTSEIYKVKDVAVSTWD